MTKTFDDTDRGVLFRDDKKAKPEDRDYSGSINIGGTEYWLSGWVKTSKKGSKFLSLSIKPLVTLSSMYLDKGSTVLLGLRFVTGNTCNNHAGLQKPAIELAANPHHLRALPAQLPHAVGKALLHPAVLSGCHDAEFERHKLLREDAQFVADALALDARKNVFPGIDFAAFVTCVTRLIVKAN